MKIKLSIILICSILSLALSSCGKDAIETDVGSADVTTDVRLQVGDDAGMEYIDSFIFIGESTTAHLKNRAVLTDGKNTQQVWATRSGTLMLGLDIDKVRIVYPKSGEELTFYEAAKKEKPRYVLLTFGLNGAVQNVKRGEEYFAQCYKKLIYEIRRGSPETKIIIQSCFPVAKNMDMSAYSVDVVTLNRYIDTINKWSENVARQEGCRYLYSAEVLKDDDGFLKQEYQIGDGHHLTQEAYLAMLEYIRNHPDK